MQLKKFQGESVLTETNTNAFLRQNMQSEASSAEGRNRALLSGQENEHGDCNMKKWLTRGGPFL